MDFSNWIAWIKLPTKTIMSLCIVFGIMIFSSGAMLSILGLEPFVAEYRAYLGVGFIITLTLTIVNSIAAIWKFVYPWIAEAYWIRIGKKRLRSLAPREKEILGNYIHNQNRSQNLPIQDGTVNALQKERIIIRGSSVGSMHGFDYIIQPWVWEYLRKHPEVLE